MYLLGLSHYQMSCKVVEIALKSGQSGVLLLDIRTDILVAWVTQLTDITQVRSDV